jgi:cellulose synthase/poly-beta-1,6-N-acetylglucosamine synthase-like glycosyltransferase
VATSESLKVSFVIPAFNEAARIQTSLQRISEYLKNVPYEIEIIVVDDDPQTIPPTLSKASIFLELDCCEAE